MSFLQPMILLALPLMALPILIHLIHQHRHRTVSWAAMMFLVRAQRMSRGMARLRYILIMLMRMAAVGTLVFAISRPLVSGWLSGVGMGKPDATLILLDRSASMGARDMQTGQSKRSTALVKLAELLEKHDVGSQLVLIDSAGEDVQALDSARALLDLPSTTASATSADMPGMLERALAYLKANESGRADIWVCSDLNENDWDAHSGRWAVLREQFARLKGVHLFLLSYADRPANNLCIRVTHVKRRQAGSRAELVLDVLVGVEAQVDSTAQASESAQRVPVEFEVNGVRSVAEVTLDAQGASVAGHRIPIDSTLRSGWGSVSLPGDSNPLDNRFYFVFSEPPLRRAVVVTDNPRTGEAFRQALAIPTEPGLQHRAEILAPTRVGQIDWENTGLVIWQAPLPGALVAEQIERFVDASHVVMFFPPDQGRGGEIFARQWGAWQEHAQEQSRLTWWRSDADLLARVGSGEALPLNDLRSYRTCTLERSGTENPGTALARLGDDRPLLVRVSKEQGKQGDQRDQGGVYFCTTLPTAQYSSFERDGVAFYVMLQRALAEGCRSLAAASQRDCGPDVLADRNQWQAVTSTERSPGVSQRELHAGVFQDGDLWCALNRSEDEDRAPVTPAATVDALFAGLAYERIDDAVGDPASLASEIWRAFLMAMALALVAEAILCLPEKKSHTQGFGEFSAAKSRVKQEAR
jgi:hypothetical protein